MVNNKNSMFVYLSGLFKSLKSFKKSTISLTIQQNNPPNKNLQKNVKIQIAFIMFVNISRDAAIHNWLVNEKPRHIYQF